MFRISKEKNVVAMSTNNNYVEKAHSGDIVLFETKDCFGDSLQNESQKMSSVPWDVINPATGPLYIVEAQVGDLLKVEILDIVLTGNSTIATAPGFGVFGENIKEEKTKIISIVNNYALFNDKIALPIKPMIGVIGTAPEGAAVPTGSPGLHGGNMDCSKIIKGSTLYLPINCDGALLAMGDVHAVMGDGEVCVCGAETPAEITVKVTVIKDCTLPTPFLISENKAISIYSAPTMDEASKGAVLNMQKFMTEEVGIEYYESSMLLSLAANVIVCQMVDPLITVRMELSFDIIEKYGYKLS